MLRPAIVFGVVAAAALGRHAARGGCCTLVKPRRRRAYSSSPELLPRVVHQIVPRSQLKENILLIGDVHGCMAELEALLTKCGFPSAAENTSVIFVGDLVNKGPDSDKVVKFVRESGALCVRGNHDNAGLALALGLRDPYPGSEWVSKLEPEDVEFLHQLPYSISVPELDLLVVHAGLVPGVPLNNQNLSDLFKMRNVVPREAGDDPAVRWNASESDKEGFAWASKWGGPQRVVFGHDAKRKVQQFPFATGLDSGACYGNQLTALHLPSNELHHVQSNFNCL